MVSGSMPNWVLLVSYRTHLSGVKLICSNPRSWGWQDWRSWIPYRSKAIRSQLDGFSQEWSHRNCTGKLYTPSFFTDGADGSARKYGVQWRQNSTENTWGTHLVKGFYSTLWTPTRFKHASIWSITTNREVTRLSSFQIMSLLWRWAIMALHTHKLTYRRTLRNLGNRSFMVVRPRENDFESYRDSNMILSSTPSSCQRWVARCRPSCKS